LSPGGANLARLRTTGCVLVIAGYITRRCRRGDAARRAGKGSCGFGKDSTMFGLIIGAIGFFGFLYLASLLGLVWTA
ncbi:MAG: hypothetical protein AAB385_07200, partial [Planctomycetota bacterium]